MISKIWKIAKIMLLIALVGSIVFGVYLFVIANGAELDLGKLETQDTNLILYDKNGKEIDYSGRANAVKYEELPKNLINAFVCIEDKNFFSHNGYDAWRILKATVKNLVSFSPTKEGASTITQQLIKNTQLSSEKTIERKVQEIKLAIDLEGVYSKEEILTAYLNVIYFGNSIYGVANATEQIFGKKVEDLTLAECVTLAGIVKNPARYSPLRNYEKSKERRDFILGEMQKDGYISEDDANQAKNEEIILSKYKKYGQSFVSAVIDEATAVLGVTENELAYGGYKIYTRYDPTLQKSIEEYFLDESNIAKTRNGELSDALALVLDNKSSLVSAYHGTYKGNLFELYRQPGSTIKPFLSYLPRISAGEMHLSSPVLDEKKSFDGYSPKNFGDKYLGWINVRDAIAKSVNTIAVENFNEHGIASAISYAEKFGLSFEEKDYALPSALGGMTKGVNVLDLSSAYLALANGGYYKKASFLEYVCDKNGSFIYKNDSTSAIEVESKENVYLMSDALFGCVKYGTASRMYSDRYQICAKTGTVANARNTQFNNDIWNLSYTSENTVCSWMGNLSNDESTALLNECTAGIYATELSKYIYQRLYDTHLPMDVEKPSGIVELAFSKDKYELEHVLVLANEFHTEEEVLRDIFNVNNLNFEVESDYYDEIEKFECVVNKGLPQISFVTKKGYSYVIKKSSLFESEEIVCEFVGDGYAFFYQDSSVLGGEDYEYWIEVRVVNYDGVEKQVIKSPRVYLSVPYDLWTFD